MMNDGDWNPIDSMILELERMKELRCITIKRIYRE